jgi:CPA1 family monovalent cation:H+ antiporter
LEHLSHTAQTVGAITALLLTAAATLSLCKRFKIPFTVTLVVVGIALASLAEAFIALVLGSVLFTLLVQGLSIERLVKHLGLDRLSYADQLARVKTLLAAKQYGLDRVAELEHDGLVSSDIAERLRAEYAAGLRRLETEIDRLRHGTLDRHYRTEEERRLLFLRSFATEKALYLDMFNKGQLSESTYRDLSNALQQETEEMRYHRRLPQRSITPRWQRRLEQFVLPLLDRIPRLSVKVRQWRMRRAAQVYALRWARYRLRCHPLRITACVNIHTSATLTPGPPDVTYCKPSNSMRVLYDCAT